MECIVHDARPRSYGSPAPREAEMPFFMEDIDTIPTPGRMLTEIGRVIAVCLGLGVLAHILVAIIGG